MDRSIPFYNLILRCDEITPAAAVLPQGFFLRAYQSGDERHWAELEYAIGDFASREEAERYFAEKYLPYEAELRRRSWFVFAEDGTPAGSCIAWQDPRGGETAASLHWMVVASRFRRRGIGRALCQTVLNFYAEQGETPVYIHTQPWSWKAVLLYGSLGFRIRKTDTFARYENQFPQAMETLARVLPEETFRRIEALTEQ